MRRKPEPRLVLTRKSDNDKRQLIGDLPPLRDLAALAGRAGYEPYSKHKLRPRAFGLEPFDGVPEDTTYCDGHADFSNEDFMKIPTLLRRGIMSGLIGDKMAQGDPKLVWTVDDNGWVYEGRITHQGRAIYHGYPLLPGDAMATKVIARFSRWVTTNGTSIENEALRAAQERYRG